MTQQSLINGANRFDEKHEKRINKAIGRLIRSARESKGLSTEDTCIQTGIKLSTLYAIEVGTMKIRVEHMYRFADVFGIDISRLLPNETELNYTPEQLSAIDSLTAIGMERENAIKVVANASTLKVEHRKQ